MRRVLFLLLLMLASGARGQDVPALTGRVVDLADLLSPEAEASLTDRLKSVEDSTSAQIAVLTVPSLQGRDLEEWATLVFRTWALGQEDLDNGVLLLIARDDRKIRIEVGYGLEATLTDAEAGAIIRVEMTPRFRDSDFEGGTIAAVDAIIGTLDGTYQPPKHVPKLTLWGFIFVAVPLAGLVLLLHDGFALKDWAAGAGCAGGFLTLPIVGAMVMMTRNWTYVALLLVLPLLLYIANRILETHPRFGPARRQRRKISKAISEAQSKGKRSVTVDGVRHSVPTVDTSSSSDWGSSSSFSGGGGSSGGGGASGGW